MSLHRAGHEDTWVYSIRIITSFRSDSPATWHTAKENADRLVTFAKRRAKTVRLAKDSVNRSLARGRSVICARGGTTLQLSMALTMPSAGLRNNTKLYHTGRFNTRLEG